MEPTTTAAGRQSLQIEWREQAGPLTVVFLREKPAEVEICEAGRRRRNCIFDISRRRGGMFGGRGSSRRRAGGFTLLELLVVLAIIGIMAGMTLPHLRGFTKSNNMSAATRQLQDDIAYARQRAIANRSIVYMVFVPPLPWTYLSQQNLNTLSSATLGNLVQGQYRGYALVSLRTVGDQPGQPHPSYLTDWRMLPTGVYIAPDAYAAQNNQGKSFQVSTTNTLSNTRNQFTVSTFTNTVTQALPFPNLQLFTRGLPYIAFSPNGSLVDENGNILRNDVFIPLTSGGILYPTDDKGNYLLQGPLISESPVGESVNNANLIHIDAPTARARLERNQF